MKELNEYTDELHRRVELKVQTQRQHRRQLLLTCIPLVVCVLAGALFLPPVLSRDKGEKGTEAAQGQETEVVCENRADEEPPKEQNGPADGTRTEENDERLPEGDDVEGLNEKSGLPEDFSFRFVWGCYGISSYDSRTGQLVKTTDATHPEDYVTTLELTEAQRAEVWKLLSDLHLERYPENYDPYNDPDSDRRVASEPNRNLILTLRANGQETTVTCIGICLGGTVQGYNGQARVFLETCDRLTELLTETPEWEALPEYEFFYE